MSKEYDKGFRLGYSDGHACKDYKNEYDVNADDGGDGYDGYYDGYYLGIEDYNVERGL